MEYQDSFHYRFMYKNEEKSIEQVIKEMNKKDFISVDILQFHWNEEDSSLEYIDILFINRKSELFNMYKKVF